MTEIIVFLKDWQRSLFANNSTTQSILESTGSINGIPSGFGFVIVSSDKKLAARVSAQKICKWCVIHFDINISIELNAHCAHAYNVAAISTRMVLGEFTKPHRWMWIEQRAHCILHVPLVQQREKHEGDLGSELWAEQSLYSIANLDMMFDCFLGSWQHLSDRNESVFSLVLLFRNTF